MKLKYHKIRNVSKDVCTYEQVIAYNIAFIIDVNCGDIYRKVKKNYTESSACDWVNERITIYTRSYRETHGERYNIDAIVCCLRAGLKKYLDRYDNHILTSYIDVGEAFPAYYL